MPAIKFKCPEKGCETMVEVWVPDYPQHETEHNMDAACPKHKTKYTEIWQRHVAECRRLGIRP